MLVERDTHRVLHEAPALVDSMSLPSNLVHTELYAACLELATPICGNAAEAAEILARLRAGARDAGATPIGVGLHPSAQPGDAETLSDDARYRYIASLLGSATLRMPECALHVHVGLPDAETAVRVLNELRPYLALLTALVANSPFLDDHDKIDPGVSRWVRSASSETDPSCGLVQESFTPLLRSPPRIRGLEITPCRSRKPPGRTVSQARSSASFQSGTWCSTPRRITTSALPRGAKGQAPASH